MSSTSRPNRSPSLDLKHTKAAAPKNSGDAAFQLLETVLRLHNGIQRRNVWAILANDDDDDDETQQQTNSGAALALQQALWQRCRELDDHHHHAGVATSAAGTVTARRTSSSDGNNNNNNNMISLERDLLLLNNNHASSPSGYTPLHWAVYAADLRKILFLLRGVTGHRFTQRPMELLYSGNSTSNTSSSSNRDQQIRCLLTSARDGEGLTAAQLLAARQRGELAACRASLTEHRVRQMRTRSRSFSSAAAPRVLTLAGQEDEQNEFDVLSRVLRGEQQRHQQQQNQSDDEEDDEDEDDASGGDNSSRASNRSESASSAPVQYGCEVFTFGRAHHCALGVVASNRRHNDEDVGAAAAANKTMRPQRVQAFAQDTVGRSGAAVALATATHHTLTVTASGELYACGLGKAGRLGTGDEKPCATSVRVMGALQRQFVVAVAAAENHSLCVTASGHVYSFGSNRFGQLGFSNSAASSSTTNAEASSTSRCLPRRVDDLKHVVCVSVAAGAKHSVALSQGGEVYVWGDNGAGQLGFSGRTSNNNSLHKVQRVEALWKSSSGPKKAIAIAASEKSTLVLTVNGSGQRGLPGNSVYSWGHGNHVPCRVNFEDNSRSRSINPVAIACARYHNVAITSEGQVFSWGLHADSLGTNSHSFRRRSSSNADKVSSASLTAPQLVTGLLPENGGGRAVAVSASEKHTAVITDDGSLFTWGDVYENHVLGHEGVRWQPDPKRVPGVHRAVAVSAAKEHTALLIGASYPPLPPMDISGSSIPSLEYFAARRIAEHVDLFNVIPILVTAERTQTSCLLEYCRDFVRRNLDGVLNVGQRGYMDCFLNEQLVSISADKKNRDGAHHPLAAQVAFAGSVDKPLFGEDILCKTEKWFEACQELIQHASISSIVARSSAEASDDHEDEVAWQYGRRRSRSESFSELSVGSAKSDKLAGRKGSLCTQRCYELTTDMNITSIDLAEAKLACLSKEARSIRKRLSQIEKLKKSEASSNYVLSEEERLKVSRRSQLEVDLSVFEPAIVSVEKRLKHLQIEQEVKLESAAESMDCPQTEKDEIATPNPEVEEDPESTLPLPILRCEVCEITCPDAKSLELHLNGRKHRNRVAQEEESNKKEAAASMMEEQQRQLLLRPIKREIPETKSESSFPWGQKKKSGSVQPRYKLPPPPHAVQEEVASPAASTPLKPKSLQEIMAEESRQSSKSKKAPFQLPPGSAPPMKSPPWAVAKARVAVASISTTTSAAGVASAKHSFGDFIDRKPAPKVLTSSKPVGWASPKAAPSVKAAPLSPPPVSFREIQKQEQTFKQKQDHTYAEGGKWFIERRERAGSFKEIQTETAKKTEEQRFVEEQIEIEKQIYEELAAHKAKEENAAKKRQGSSRRKKNNNKFMERRTGNESTGLAKRTNGDAAKPEGRPRKRVSQKDGKKPSKKSGETPTLPPISPDG